MRLRLGLSVRAQLPPSGIPDPTEMTMTKATSPTPVPGCRVELLPDGSEMQVVKVAEVTPELKLQVVYEYWRAGFERSYHGAPAEYDLGCIDE